MRSCPDTGEALLGSDAIEWHKEWRPSAFVHALAFSLLPKLYQNLKQDCFLLVQVIILLDFTHSWHDAWVAKDEQKWYVALLVISVGCYIAAYTRFGILFIWFNPSGEDYGLNVFFLVMTMVLGFVNGIFHPVFIE
ncbi:hypothetical protein NL676_030167 [Syzygium grande]|nr:hypothetical protein NL676_030167 [Syzygium grande]